MAYNIKKLTEHDNTFNRLIEIEYSILDIYDILVETSEKEEEYQKNLEYLKIAVEAEEKLMEKLDWKNLEPHNFNRLEYLIVNKEYDDEITNGITLRLEKYYAQLNYINPFLSNEKDFIEQINENYITIELQAELDYIENLIIEIEKEIKKEPTKTGKKLLIQAKNNVIFNNKIFEKYLFHPTELEKKPTVRKETCLIFNHKKECVDEVYRNYSKNIIDGSLDTLTKYTDKKLSHSKEEQIGQKLNLLTLEIGLSLLDEETKNTVTFNFIKITTPNTTLGQWLEQSPKNFNAIKEVFHINSEKAKEKRKE